MKKLLLLFAVALTSLSYVANAQPKPQPFSEDLSYFLPEKQWNYTLNENIPTPKQYLGFEVGQQMVSYEQVVSYIQTLASHSDRFSIKEYGRTYENRPIVCVAITSPENQKNLENIRKEHQKLSDPNYSGDLKNQVSVVEIMLSIHGNEASGVNAGVPFAYFWAAAQGQEIDKILDETVILLVPGQNPDGINRFATWVNSHRSMVNNTDPQSMEFREVSPGGRSNHYWHDLNRDWINAVHPEIKALLSIYQAWMPNIVNDHHEQGRDSHFFLEPSDPVAYYPYIPQEQKDLTNEVSKYEIALLDQIGSLYFSRDSYDSYSLGTGDVYPDALGSIAMLFEQPSSRGMQQESANGLLNFQFTVRNQALCAFGAVEAGHKMRHELNDFMNRFVKKSYADAKKQVVKGWVLDGNGSDATSWHFIEMLRQHGLQAYKLAKDYTQDGFTYKAENSYIVPAEQKHSVVLNSLFDSNTHFVDSLFYDISTWNLAEAYGLKYSRVKSVQGLVGDLANGVQADGSVTEMVSFPEGGIIGGKSSMAYIFDNKEYYVPYVINGLQEKGIRVMVARNGAKAENSDIQHTAGALIVPVASQTVSADSIYNTLSKLSKEAGVKVESVTSSRMSDFDLGHYTNKVVRKPEVAILGTAGVPWFILNYRMQMTPTLLDASTNPDLSRYNVIIMTSSVSNKQLQDNIAEWVKGGGTLITVGSAYRSANDMKLTDIKVKELERAATDRYINFADRADYNSTFSIPGTDLLAQMDYTHPLCWGYTSPMPVLKQSTVVFDTPKDVNSAPVWYDKNEPLLSGYLRSAHKESLKGAPVAICSRAGSGVVISFADDINFRSTWFAGTRMFMNAIFFGNLTTGR